MDVHKHGTVPNSAGVSVGVVMSDGQEHRLFSLKVLPDLGMGKPVLERNIQEETVILVSTTDSGRYLALAASNIICGLLFGHRFFYDDPEYVGNLHVLDELAGYSKDCAPLNAVPWLQYLAGDMFLVNRIKTAYQMAMRWTMK